MIRVSHQPGRLSLLDGDAEVGWVAYERQGDLVQVDHVEVDRGRRGQGLGRRLVAETVAWARAEGLRVEPVCPFAVAEFARNRSYGDVRSR